MKRFDGRIRGIVALATSPLSDFEARESSQMPSVTGDEGVAFGRCRGSYEQIAQLQTLVLLFELSLGFGGYFGSLGIEGQVVYPRQQYLSLASALPGLFAAGVFHEKLPQHQLVKSYVRNDDPALLEPGKGLQGFGLETDGCNQEVGIQDIFTHRADLRRVTLARVLASSSVKESSSLATHAFMAGSSNSYLSRTSLRSCGRVTLRLIKALTAIYPS